MPGPIFTEYERKKFSSFPKDISNDDIITFFTLSPSDKDQIPVYNTDRNKLGFGVLICTYRYLGFCPELRTISNPIIKYIGKQLDIDSDHFQTYAQREQTRTDHIQKIQNYLGFRKITDIDSEILNNWLTDRAMEHDKPVLLLQFLCEKLLCEKLIRPGITTLERMVIRARQNTEIETYKRLEFLLTDETKFLLDQLLVIKPNERRLLSWLNKSATSNSSQEILNNLLKIDWLKQKGIDKWDINVLNPNRVKFLAQTARKSTVQILQRYSDEKRYPILLVFLYQSLIDITDETIEMFDKCLAECYSNAKNDFDEFKKSIYRITNLSLKAFRKVGEVIFDDDIENESVREEIYKKISREHLNELFEKCGQIVRPSSDNTYFDFLKRRYGYLRQFVPSFFKIINFHSNLEDDSLIEAIELIHNLDKENKRKVPQDATLDFVNPKWFPYMFDDKGKIIRSYYELSVLSELRDSVRSGSLWVENSRCYADLDTYLILRKIWPDVRPEICEQINTPEDGFIRLKDKAVELETLLPRANRVLAQNNSKVRIEKGKLIVEPLKAKDRPASVIALERLISKHIPQIDLSELLVEVDTWTHFSDNFEHISGNRTRSKDTLQSIYASILAQACNIHLSQMAQSADLSKDQLTWYNHWYVREDTLKGAITKIVNYHHQQPLSIYWGDGTLSSSDGQRFPVSVKSRTAVSLPRYFGYGKGLTFYTWTSDQFSQYGTKVIPSTVRDATYVLDEILNNETELSIIEHTTDTAGYTELVFALFDLLGMKFSPRIADIKDQHMYRIDKSKKYPNLECRLKGTIKVDLILKYWDEILRVAGSMKSGWVTASLFISKLQAYPRKHLLTKVLQEYGRLNKTIFMLKYIESEEFRRYINRQINKGEALHGLRRFILFANEGKIRKKFLEDQMNQASCLNLVTNAVVLWNTVYMTDAIDKLKSEGYEIDDSDLMYISPARFEHINPYGKYRFEINRDRYEQKESRMVKPN